MSRLSNYCNRSLCGEAGMSLQWDRHHQGCPLCVPPSDINLNNDYTRTIIFNFRELLAMTTLKINLWTKSGDPHCRITDGDNNDIIRVVFYNTSRGIRTFMQFRRHQKEEFFTVIRACDPFSYLTDGVKTNIDIIRENFK